MVVPLEVRWLLVGSIALSLFSIGVLLYTLKVGDELKSGHRKGSYLLFGMGGIALAFGFIGDFLTTIILLGCLLILLLIPIFYALYIRLKISDGAQGNDSR